MSSVRINNIEFYSARFTCNKTEGINPLTSTYTAYDRHTFEDTFTTDSAILMKRYLSRLNEDELLYLRVCQQYLDPIAYISSIAEYIHTNGQYYLDMHLINCIVDDLSKKRELVY